MGIMGTKQFHIKNMVCTHCGEVLERRIKEAGYEIHKIELGMLELKEPIDKDDFEALSQIVQENGFEIISDRQSQLVEQIKHLILDVIHDRKELEGNLSEFLEAHLHRDYHHLSRLFSSVEGKSIERFYILQKIERAKELIVYGEDSFAEIAYDLGYSSQQHFSRQFKKETGLTPSHFREVKENKRISIDHI
jgi:AraC family transcriptional regulator